MTNFEALQETCDYNTKVALAGWVFGHVLAHAKVRGSYRGLVYERLGFGPDAYAHLLDCGALEISNTYDLVQSAEIRRIVREQKIDALKSVLRLCDQEGCFADACCGTQSTNEYRWTCVDHRPVEP